MDDFARCRVSSENEAPKVGAQSFRTDVKGLSLSTRSPHGLGWLDDLSRTREVFVLTRHEHMGRDHDDWDI